MEKYILKKLTEEDEYEFDEFVFEHIVNDELEIVCDNSLITGKSYVKYGCFKDWFEVHKLVEQYNVNANRTQGFNYLLFKESDDHKRLISTFEIRTNLTPKTECYGNISINIRPSERGKGYYSLVLKYALAQAKALNLDKVNITFPETDEITLKTIKKIAGDSKIKKVGNRYSYTFCIKQISDKALEDYIDLNIDSLVYVTTPKLYEDKLERGLNADFDITQSLNKYYDMSLPYNYVYVCNKDNFELDRNGNLVSKNNVNPLDILKVTTEQFLNLPEKKKTIK